MIWILRPISAATGYFPYTPNRTDRLAAFSCPKESLYGCDDRNCFFLFEIRPFSVRLDYFIHGSLC